MSLNLLNPFQKFASGGGVNYWQEIGRATATGATDTLNILGKSAMPYNLIISRAIPADSNGFVSALRVGKSGSLDVGSNYSRRRKIGSAGAETATSQDAWYTGGGANGCRFQIAFIKNFDGYEKLADIYAVRQNSSGGAPTITEMAGKWAETSGTFDSVGLWNDESGSFGAESEIVWLGFDPASSNSSAFTELANSSLTGSADFINSGTLSSTEEYLVINELVKQSSSYSAGIVFNGDGNGTTNYDFQYHTNDNYGDNSNTWKFTSNYDAYSDGMQATTFVMNLDGQEKLGISFTNEVDANSASTAPAVSTWAGKYETTGTDITSVQRYKEAGAGGGQLQSGTSMLVTGFS
tara:strand:+ start:253 stop:1305 length:1053 start_codon:yes stop_codon:yes gene_type:complete